MNDSDYIKTLNSFLSGDVETKHQALTKLISNRKHHDAAKNADFPETLLELAEIVKSPNQNEGTRKADSGLTLTLDGCSWLYYKKPEKLKCTGIKDLSIFKCQACPCPPGEGTG